MTGPASDDDLKIALVSNRGPVSFAERDGSFEIKGPAGGVAPTLHRVASRLHDRAVWFAAAISDDDREAVAAGEMKRVRDELGYRVDLIDIDAETYRRYYDVVSNRMLWFANHCLWDELDVKSFGDDELTAWEDAYEPVNRRFAEHVAELGDPSWLVLFQDYHFSLAPKILRELSPQQTIFHFTHSSFCGPNGLDRLPHPLPRRVIEGMLGADLVGFHVRDWVQGFLASCRKIGAEVDDANGIVTYEGRRSWVREYPIPIDAADLRRRSLDPKAVEWKERFLRDLDGRLVVRADRVEPSKNIVRGFEAFGVVLDRRPDLRDTKFVACLYPSRQSMPEYQRYTDEVEAAVRRVNERHPGSILFYNKDDFDRTLGAYRVYDILLVNSIMDGMNLVAKEGAALNERNGVLVLSPSAGAFEELGSDAVSIDAPLEVEATARALERALDMPAEEREKRARALREQVDSRTPEDWIEDQLADMSAVRSGGPPLTPPS
ncbi:MAG: trehalose-6-phosphate synthase [Actinobacteria bacterium]|nr:trehalose-6-phosphate synthase [Actinomycetota bacterium]